MTCVTGEAPEPAVVGAGDFDPADHAAFAEIAEFVFGILATTIVMWFSRWREYRADEGGAELAGRRNMINALKRLQASQGKPALPDEMAALAINAGRMQAFFASHPPLKKRIEALQQNAR